MDIGVQEIDQWHKERGFSSCGYHYVIRRNGRVERGRDVERGGAHAKGFNAKSLGVCLVGGKGEGDVSDCNFTFEQYQSLYDLISDLKVQFPITKVLGHRDLKGVTKDCPCFDVISFVS
jgi:N-acetyl-anhydromuramyl-L-alanine amidase AmpD